MQRTKGLSEHGAVDDGQVDTDLRKYLRSPNSRAIVAKALQELGGAGAKKRVTRLDRDMGFERNPDVMGMRLRFVCECIKIDPALLTELCRLWREYARDVRDEINKVNFERPA